MKIYAIRDESVQEQKDLAYLLYYGREKQFYIELPENADAWETPLLLDSFVKRGETTVNSYWSKIWVQQRIVPIDRQNIGEILRDNHLKEYDEYELLMLAMGRCAQDDYYLVPINEKELPEEITRRFSKRIEDVLPLENHCLLVFFRDGVVKKCDLQKHFEKTKTFQVLLKKPDYFQYVQMQTGGYGVAWDVNMTISDTMLYRIGKSVPLTMKTSGTLPRTESSTHRKRRRYWVAPGRTSLTLQNAGSCIQSKHRRRARCISKVKS